MIERKGAEVLVTRDCLSNLEGFRYVFTGILWWIHILESFLILYTSYHVVVQIVNTHQDRHSSRQVWRMSSSEQGCETWPVCSQQNWGARCVQVLAPSWYLYFAILVRSFYVFSGTTMTTRRTASVTLTTGAILPPTSSHLDLWQLLASSFWQLFSDDSVWLVVSWELTLLPTYVFMIIA